MFGFVTTAALAASVGTETREGAETRQGRSIENSENIQIRKGQTQRSTTGADQRTANERAREARQTDDVSAELQGSALFVPMIQEIELGHVNTGGNTVAAIFRECQFFTATPAIPIALGPFPDPVHLNFLGGGTVAGIKWPSGTNPRTRVSGEWVWKRYSWYDRPLAYRFDTPRNLVRCNFAYGHTVATAMRLLADEGAVRETPLKEKVVLVRGNLEERAAQALVAAMRSPTVQQQIETDTRRVTSADCLVPSLYGLQQGSWEWQCGSMKIDPGRLQATMAGMTVLGENQFMGQRLSFAQVSGHTINARSSDSQSKYSSRETGREDARDVSMGKRRSDSLDQTTTTGTSGTANTNASPR
ncbi:MAG: hypothetical protein RBT53_05995 [Azonexus sp.]|nr:hypothetical protein [Azonexus sp.]